jgi:predicted nucleotidyltransferase
VARNEDNPNSDIDLYIEFTNPKLPIGKMLKAEGRILEAFGDTPVDIVSGLKSEKTFLLKKTIEQEGVRVF